MGGDCISGVSGHSCPLPARPFFTSEAPSLPESATTMTMPPKEESMEMSLGKVSEAHLPHSPPSSSCSL